MTIIDIVLLVVIIGLGIYLKLDNTKAKAFVNELEDRVKVLEAKTRTIVAEE